MDRIEEKFNKIIFICKLNGYKDYEEDFLEDYRNIFSDDENLRESTLKNLVDSINYRVWDEAKFPEGYDIYSFVDLIDSLAKDVVKIIEPQRRISNIYKLICDYLFAENLGQDLHKLHKNIKQLYKNNKYAKIKAINFINEFCKKYKHTIIKDEYTELINELAEEAKKQSHF